MKCRIFVANAILLLVFAYYAQGQIAPNMLISKGKSVYTSKGNASYLVDQKFNATAFTVTNNSWVAAKLVKGPSKIYFTWNNPAYTWSDVIAAAHSCKGSPSMPVNYTIQTSPNSTNGADGTWTTVATIKSNTVTARGHVVKFEGASWIKMNITEGGGTIDEIEIFDLSNESTDRWFFVGTSISANTYKATPPAKNFADLIVASFNGFYPSMIRGGIPCIGSTDLVTDISKYLSVTRDVKYWAIEMGTNDAWGGSNYNVKTFVKNMQIVIDSCKNAGIEPILARMIGTNSTAAGWQVHSDFLKAIDSLTEVNGLIDGPDLYAWFSTHPDDLNSDGVHPNSSGAARIQKLWAEKMAGLYPSGGVVTALPHEYTSDVRVYPNPSNGDINICFNQKSNQTVDVYDEKGTSVFKTFCTERKVQLHTQLAEGVYFLRLTSPKGFVTKKIVVYK